MTSPALRLWWSAIGRIGRKLAGWRGRATRLTAARAVRPLLLVALIGLGHRGIGPLRRRLGLSRRGGGLLRRRLGPGRLGVGRLDPGAQAGDVGAELVDVALGGAAAEREQHRGGRREKFAHGPPIRFAGPAPWSRGAPGSTGTPL